MALTRLSIVESIESITNVTSKRDLINRAVQISLDKLTEWHDWPYYIQDKGVIETIDDYTTGTVTATNGSKTITGSGTTFTAAMVGRKIRVNDANPFYRIAAFVSTTELTLEFNYQGDTIAGATYLIFRDEYRLNSDVDKYKLLRQAENNVALFSLHPSRFDLRFPMPQSYADPLYEVMEGTLLDTETTGTVAASGNTITGVGTSWLSVEGLGRLSMIRIGNDVYHIKSVDSDTKITTYETLTTATAGKSYEITLNNLRVQLYHIPNAQKLLYYRYFRRPAILANNYDLPDMPFQWHWVLIWGGLEYAFLQKGDINKADITSGGNFEKSLNLMKSKLGSFTPDRIYQRQSIDRFRSRRGLRDGLEKANFDRRYSV